MPIWIDFLFSRPIIASRLLRHFFLALSLFLSLSCAHFISSSIFFSAGMTAFLNQPKRSAKGQKFKKKSVMYLLEVCVSPSTANSPLWHIEFVPMATQLLLANRPAFIIVRNSWNPMPFEHYPSNPATCQITTRDRQKYVWTDAKIWSRNEIRATCEDCDFVAGGLMRPLPGIPGNSRDCF
uniref:Uncharacterized protein n=1 Tax=Caenorhabditis japonica TaxID=281687 RepID=A0A8R1HMY7_CAEJA